MEKSKSSLLSSSLFCVRQMVLRVGFKFRLANARVRMPRPSRLLMALLAGYGVQAMALPSGGQVAAGNVTIATPSGNALDITQTSAKGIINWQSFNVGSGEKVNFLQPSATSSTLNRVVGSDPSSIFGQINANGQVFLINNSGVLFGRGAQVNAAGLVASTLQLADSDYLAGNYTLSGAGGSITNEGVLKAGFVALAGAQVTNTGTIVANGGTAALAAGDRVTLNLIGSDLVSVSVDAPTAAALVHAGGIVQADGGQVLITAKAADALLGTVVNVDGIVQAHSIGSRNGVVTLDGGASGVVAVSGTLDASGKGAGQTGGTVKVTGADVGLFGQASIDASGDAGGGVVRVGGDWHGAGADGDANASQVFAASGSTINANAISSGQGGNVVLWSNERTVAVGTITANGGVVAGDGGAIETSSAHSLQVAGTVDASAAHGSAGKWLIDPSEITISSSADSGGGGAGTSGDPFVASPGPSSNLNTTTLHNALNGAAVTVQASGVGGGDGVITVADAVTSKNNGNSSLTLDASGGIAFTSGSIAPGGSGRLAVTLIAGSGGVSMDSGSSITTGPGGALIVNSGGGVSLGALSVGNGTTGAGLTIVAAGDVGQTAGWNVSNGTTSVTTSSGNITLNGANTFATFSARDTDTAGGASHGNVAVTTSGALALGNVNGGTSTSLAGDLTVSAGGTVSQAGVLQVAGTVAVTTTAGNIALTAGNSIATFAAHDSDAAGNVSVKTDGALALAGVDDNAGGALGGGLTVTAGGTVSQSAALKVAGTTSVTTSGGNITLNGANTLGTFAARDTDTAGGAGNVAVTTSGALALGNVDGGTSTSLAGDLTVSAGGTVSQAGVLQVAGTTTVTTTAGNIVLTAGNSIAKFAAHDADAAGDVSVKTSGALALAGVDNGSGGALGGDLTVTAGGTVSQSATLKVAGTTDVTTTTGNITLTGSNTIGTFAAHDTGSGANVAITTGGALVLAGVDNGSGGALGGGLTVSAGGAVTQTAAIKVAGTTAVGTTAGDIALTGSNTIAAFSAQDSDAAGNVAITTGGALALGAINNGSGGTLAGNLTVSAGGAVTQSATLKVAGTTSASTSTGNITLTGANTIGTFIAHDAGSGANVSITTGGALVLAGVDNGSGGALGGGLTVSAGGAVTQSAALKVAGTADVTTTTGDITLTGSNSIAGFGAHDAGAGANVSITTGGALVLSNVDNNAGAAIGGILTVSAGGTVSQAASTAVRVGGTTSATTTSGNIALGNSGNTFAGAVSATGASINVTATGNLNVTPTLGSGGSLTLAANGGGSLTIPAGTISTTGDVSLTAGGGLTTNGDISAGNVSLGGGALTIGNHIVASGTFGATSTSTISESGAGDINATGLATLSAPGNAINLSAATNNFQGGTSFSGSNVTLVNAGALAVAGTATGNLDVTATGAITQGGVLHVTGTSALNAGSNAITLTTSTNDFGGTVTATGGTVSLADANTLTVGGSMTGLVTVSAPTVDVEQAGALTVHLDNVGSAVVQSGAVATVEGSSTGNVSATGNGVVLGAAAIGGNLAATSTGTITQAGTLHVTGISTFNAGSNAIALDMATNDFGGTVTATSSGAVSLADTNTLTVVGNMTGGVTVSAATANVSQTGALTVHLNNVGSGVVQSNGVLTVDGASTGNLSATGNGVVLGATTVGGNLAATSTGTITQTGTLHVTGTSALNAGSNAVTLDTATNDFGGAVTATGSGAVSLADANTLTVSGGNLTGLLTVSAAAANVSQAAALTVHLNNVGSGTVQSGALTTVDGTSTGNLSATGNGVVFGTTTVGGNLTAAGGTGTITQTGALAVTGTSTLGAGSNAITLANPANDFGGAVTVTSTGAVSLADANALTVGGSMTGLVTVSATTADVEQAGALTVHLDNVGSAIVKSGAALDVNGSSTGDVTANGASVTFGSGATSVGGKLTATSSGGDIKQDSTLAVTGTATLAAGSGNVTLANAGNALAGAVTASGANVTLADASPLTAHLAANGSATLTSAGALSVDGSAAALTATGASITQGGALAVTGLSQFDAGSGDILLDSPGTNLQGAITATGHTIRLTDTHAIDATLTSTGDVVLNSSAEVKAKGTIGGQLGITSTGDTTLADVTTKGAQITAGGTLLLGGTLTSSGNVTLKGQAIQGVNKLGALDVAAGSTASLTATSGNIGKTTPLPRVIDDLAIIQLVGVTGQSGLSVNFNSGQSAWFRVASQTQTGKLVVNQFDFLRSQTSFCDLATCVNLLGQSTSIADSVIANILTAASQDAADAAFGTENLDFAIRKGYVTTIGRVPPGIDEIAGDLGGTQCDSRVTSPTAIAADKACSAGK